MQRFRKSFPAVLGLSLLLAACGGGGKGGKNPPAATDGVVRVGYVTPDLPLANATVIFYDAAGTRLGTAVVGPDGLIVGAGFPTAKSFAIDPSTTTVDGTFYGTFLYNGQYYSAACGAYAPLPSTGAVRLPKDVAVFKNTTPPPPPIFGCGG